MSLKKFIPSLFLLAVVTAACSDDSSYPMCTCEIDEVSIDDKCVKFPDDFAPAPSDDDQ